MYLRKDNDGVCYLNEREIRINKRLRGREFLETVIHELTHGAFPTHEEEHVKDFAKGVSDLLHKLGYKRETDVQKK